MKWIFVVAVVVVLLGLFAPQLAKLGLWRLPGDFRFRLRGREVFLPITTTVLISLALTVLARVFRL